MTIQEYIENVGMVEASKELEVDIETIRKWYRGESRPNKIIENYISSIQSKSTSILDENAKIREQNALAQKTNSDLLRKQIENGGVDAIIRNGGIVIDESPPLPSMLPDVLASDVKLKPVAETYPKVISQEEYNLLFNSLNGNNNVIKNEEVKLNLPKPNENLLPEIKKPLEEGVNSFDEKLITEEVENKKISSIKNANPKVRFGVIISDKKKKSIAICMPSYKFAHPVIVEMFYKIAKKYGKKNSLFQEPASLFTSFGDAMIYNSRNKIAENFLASGYEWSLWIDDDMILPLGDEIWFKDRCNIRKMSVPFEKMDVIERLISHNKQFVGACYFGRNINGAPMFSEALYDPHKRVMARNYVDAIIETDWVATGCLLVHRTVFESIMKTQPILAPGSWENLPVVDESTGKLIYKKCERKHWNFFGLNNEVHGEDVHFSLRAKKAGIQPYVDLGCQPFHLGFNPWGAYNTHNDELQVL